MLTEDRPPTSVALQSVHWDFWELCNFILLETKAEVKLNYIRRDSKTFVFYGLLSSMHCLVEQRIQKDSVSSALHSAECWTSYARITVYGKQGIQRTIFQIETETKHHLKIIFGKRKIILNSLLHSSSKRLANDIRLKWRPKFHISLPKWSLTPSLGLY